MNKFITILTAKIIVVFHLPSFHKNCLKIQYFSLFFYITTGINTSSYLESISKLTLMTNILQFRTNNDSNKSAIQTILNIFMLHKLFSILDQN